MIRTLCKDYIAIFNRDPAARSWCGFLEVFFTYSGWHAIISHRICHFLHTMKVPFIPRLVSQITRFLTGIEIHPGAQIKPGFFIDHGMGVVIGETTEIGENVTIYQGVTLGGTGKDKGKRHPTIGNNVVVGAGAKVLGNIIIGDDVKIGAGSVVIDPIPPHSTVVGVPGVIVRQHGEKIQAANLDHGDLPHPVEEKMKVLKQEIDEMVSTIQQFKNECNLYKKKLQEGGPHE